MDSDNLLISLLLAAHSAIDPSLQQSTSSSSLSCTHPNQKSIIPSIGPLYRWTEIDDHPGLVSALSKIPLVPNSSLQHQSFLMAFEPDQIWIQHLFIHPTSRLFNIHDSTIKNLTTTTTTTSKLLPSSTTTATTITTSSSTNTNTTTTTATTTSTTLTTTATNNLSGNVNVHNLDRSEAGQMSCEFSTLALFFIFILVVYYLVFVT